MATSTLQDNEIMSGLFKDALSPITNYSQGLLALAVQRKQRDLQQADETRKENFTRERDTARGDLEMRLQNAAEARADKRLRDSWAHTDQVGKQSKIDELRGIAERMGLPLPDKKLSLDDQADQLNTVIGKGSAERVTNLIQSGRDLHQQLNQMTGSNETERGKLAIKLLLGDPASRALTPAERLALAEDPTRMFSIQERLAKDKSKKGKIAYDDFLTAQNQTDAAATEFYAKRAPNREAVGKVTEALADQRQVLGSVLKDPYLPPGLFSHMFDGVAQEAKQIKIENDKKAAPLPPQPVAVGGPSPALPPVPSMTSRNAVQGVSSPVSPGAAASPFNPYPWSVTQPPIGAPASPAATAFSPPDQGLFQTGGPVDPSVLATLRLRRAQQDAAATNNTFFPLSSPALSPNQ